MTILLAVLAGSLLLFRALGAIGPLHMTALATWPAATRWALATLLLLTASAHFNRMQYGLIRMVPAWVPNPKLAVQLTGLCEILGAIGLLLPPVRRYAGLALVLFLIAVFPANIRAARENLPVAGRPATPLWIRGPVQLLLIALVWWSSWAAP